MENATRSVHLAIWRSTALALASALFLIGSATVGANQHHLIARLAAGDRLVFHAAQARFPCLAACGHPGLATGILRIRGGGGAEKRGASVKKTRAGEKGSGIKEKAARTGVKRKKESRVREYTSDSAPSSIVDDVEAELAALNTARRAPVRPSKQQAGDAVSKSQENPQSSKNGMQRDRSGANASGKRNIKQAVGEGKRTASKTRTFGSSQKEHVRATARKESGVEKSKVKKKKDKLPVTAEAIRWAALLCLTHTPS